MSSFYFAARVLLGMHLNNPTPERLRDASASVPVGLPSSMLHAQGTLGPSIMHFPEN